MVRLMESLNSYAISDAFFTFFCSVTRPIATAPFSIRVLSRTIPRRTKNGKHATKSMKQTIRISGPRELGTTPERCQIP